jgi:hypothetical protein
MSALRQTQAAAGLVARSPLPWDTPDSNGGKSGATSSLARSDFHEFGKIAIGGAWPFANGNVK